ncbi:zinc finger protein 532 isoform 7-T7 [Rhinophrynus dorsalis]
MGDMKTPDFDDLLAAFDIPDMVDPKAAIESGHDDHESHIKQNSQIDDDAHAPSSSDVGVSVIVKNIRTVDSSEAPEKDNHHSTGNGLHNGFLTASNIERFNKEEMKSLKDNAIVSDSILKESAFNQFSPISSAEEFDEDEKIEVDDPPEDLSSNFSTNILTGSISQHTSERDKPGSVEKSKANKRDSEASSTELKVYDTSKVRKLDEKMKENVQRLQESKVNDGKSDTEKSEANEGSVSKSKSSAKFSSCIAAIAALSAKKTTCEPIDLQPDSRGSSPVPKEVDCSPLTGDKSPDSQLTVQNLIDGTKKSPVKPPDSPRSVSSENSSKGSPSSGGSTPAIPKVRIKTIKTSSGEIKRTITRVLPDFESDGAKKTPEQTSPVVVSTLLSSPTSAAVLSSPTRASLQPAVAPTVASTDVTPKQVTIKPVATAFLPVSAVKTAGSQVINLKFANNTTVKATVISAASVQSASNAIIKAANAIQQQTVVVPASSLTNAKLVPKTVHFANLNLLPQGSQTSTEIRQVLTKPQQQIKQALVSAAATTTPPKKVSRVQVVASSQSSVVEAFNKVLSSVNPVPVYVPNLSPPANAGITLPARGYKCLECGDAFALEKSLLQHYDRRSVRIEVTCNHCSKNLVFYNKCSLLSHARGHKEKGVVMQCSHLILKPVPTDQMISSPQSNVSTTTLATRQNPVAVVAHTVTKMQSGVTGPVISAPVSAPITPAMPLDEDPSKLCRHSLKCLECNEVFQDETSLATHYQHAADSSGQQMKKHPCRQCEKSFSSSHSLCRHNRIKHKGIRKVYTCPHCPDSKRAFTKRMMLEKHIQLIHAINEKELKETTETTKAEPPVAKEDTKLPTPKRKLEEPVMEFRPPRGAITQPLKKLKINVFKVHKCAVCGFTTENLLQFHEHIPQHRSDVSSYQCRECGLCYTSHVSLSRHLFIVHKLKEPQPSPKQNGSAEENQQENKPSADNQAVETITTERTCTVCAKAFETEAALNTHMRTHGMAFIKSKRMSSTEK